MTKAKLTICSTKYHTKHSAVHFGKKASWLNLPIANYGVEYLPDSLQAGGEYGQILVSGHVYWRKQSLIRAVVFFYYHTRYNTSSYFLSCFSSNHCRAYVKSSGT